MDFSKYVNHYISSSKKIKFIDSLSYKKIHGFENRLNNQFSTDYYDDTIQYSLFEEAIEDDEYYTSDNEYNISTDSETSDVEYEYY